MGNHVITDSRRAVASGLLPDAKQRQNGCPAREQNAVFPLTVITNAFKKHIYTYHIQPKGNRKCWTRKQNGIIHQFNKVYKTIRFMGHATSGHPPMYLVLLVSGRQSEPVAKKWLNKKTKYLSNYSRKIPNLSNVRKSKLSLWSVCGDLLNFLYFLIKFLFRLNIL